MKPQVVPVILCGGSGTRLWPLSRSMRPKQFISLSGEGSLFQNTVRRLQSIDGVVNPVILCNEEHRFMVAEQLRELAQQHNAIILEPAGRNTAPAIASAAFKLARLDQAAALMLVLPADHIIGDTGAFAAAVKLAVASAQQGNLVTFGITPTGPSSGYGYIRATVGDHGNGVFTVDRFVEKPDGKTAEGYISEGGYFWNSGMFVFRADTFLEQLQKLHPDIHRATAESVEKGEQDLDFFRLNADAYLACDSISVDYAVMEHADPVRMVPLSAKWRDIGSWSSLWEAGDKDSSGNVTRGDVWLESVRNSYIHAENKLVSAIGVDDLIVVETHDGVMVTAKSRDQDIGKMVNRLRDSGRQEVELHRKAFRPWGNYDCLDSGDRFQVKRIMVKPGQCTSMQRHSKRAEHWIVVAGTAEVTRGDETFLLQENQSTFIPLGTFHRLKNPGPGPLEIIEVQSGSYLGEDDIERIDDDYGRS